MRDLLDRLLGGGKTHSQQSPAAESIEALQGERKVRTALVRRDCVNLVDDDGARRRKHRAPGLRSEQDVEGLRRGDDDVGRTPAHALALAGWRIAGAHPGTDLDIGQALLCQRRANSGERGFEVALDVVR